MFKREMGYVKMGPILCLKKGLSEGGPLFCYSRKGGKGGEEFEPLRTYIFQHKRV